MRYHYELKPFGYSKYSYIYECDHPVYSKCTLYKKHKKGLAVIQQYYSVEDKKTWWGPIKGITADVIYFNENFNSYFESMAAEPDKNGLYPTITLRQCMWALRMKPMKRERWETVFDHKPV